MAKDKIGLFFGSFNPIHVGHLIIANFMVSKTDLKEVWLVVSPQNPLKSKSSLARDRERLHMVRLAIDDNPMLRASDIEFNLPKPSYTIDTLTYLREKYEKKEFVLIMGGDNLGTLSKWKNHEIILRDYSIYVYKRPKYEVGPLADNPNVNFFESPLLDISASYIRNCIEQGLSIKYLVHDEVMDYISGSSLYKKKR